MTRFARAKGSKASNERLPNEATPWHVMKQQLEDSQSKSEDSSKRAKSAKQLLQEKDELFYSDTIGNVNNDWAEFDETKSKKSQNPSNNVKSNKKEKQSRVKKDENALVGEKNNSEDSKKHVNTNETKKTPPAKRKSEEIYDNAAETTPKKQKNKLPEKEVPSLNLSEPEQCGKKEENQKPSKKRKRDKKVTKSPAETTAENNNTLQTEKDGENASNNTDNIENPSEDTKKGFEKLSKRQKRNMKKKGKNGPTDDNQSSSAFNVTGNDWTTSIKSSGVKRNFNEGNKSNEQKFNRNPMDRPNNFNNKPNAFGNRKFDDNNANNKRKLPKVRDDKEHKRRKPESGPTRMVINGIEVEIVKYDGFPVRKEDAVRLRDLRQQMIMRGIPQSDINTAMKLERRKAEKALARIKKCVCFHCRKSGHNLSDCPELGSEQAGTGICFKCGSTEHTHFECKVNKTAEYRFATCFICREQGHISKQCPDNPKGIYPQGGACKICGDVTHLKKDCPDLVREKEETAITVDTITNSTLESLEKDVKKVEEGNHNNSRNKIVKF